MTRSIFTGSHLGLALLLAATVCFAGPRTSASYSISTDSADSGGARTTSANYTHDASAGGLGGLSSAAAPAETARAGYVGQLYEVVSVQVTASPASMNEGTTLQLSASATLDDGSTLGALASSVAWSIVNGPISGVSGAGVVTAGNVYQDTSATVQGRYWGTMSTQDLTVLNVGSDDFGIYAGDGIADSWQVQYFGSNNPKAAPNAISDGSGLTNLFKYTAGLIPNNASSTFTFYTLPAAGQPSQRDITFGPAFADRQYTIQFSTDLTTWSNLSGPFAGNNGTETVTDAGAGSRKFYRVQVIKP